MRFLGATYNPETLYVMIGSCIRADICCTDMIIPKNHGNASRKITIMAKYVEIYEESSILSREFAKEFPKAKSTWRALGGKA